MRAFASMVERVVYWSYGQNTCTGHCRSGTPACRGSGTDRPDPALACRNRQNDCADRVASARGARAKRGAPPGSVPFAATPHVVFYRVVDDTPEIVRLPDGRQDIEEKFATVEGE